MKFDRHLFTTYVVAQQDLLTHNHVISQIHFISLHDHVPTKVAWTNPTKNYWQCIKVSSHQDNCNSFGVTLNHQSYGDNT